MPDRPQEMELYLQIHCAELLLAPSPLQVRCYSHIPGSLSIEGGALAVVVAGSVQVALYIGGNMVETILVSG